MALHLRPRFRVNYSRKPPGRLASSRVNRYPPIPSRQWSSVYPIARPHPATTWTTGSLVGSSRSWSNEWRRRKQADACCRRLARKFGRRIFLNLTRRANHWHSDIIEGNLQSPREMIAAGFFVALTSPIGRRPATLGRHTLPHASSQRSPSELCHHEFGWHARTCRQAARVSAANAILDRGWDKTAQAQRICYNLSLTTCSGYVLIPPMALSPAPGGHVARG